MRMIEKTQIDSVCRQEGCSVELFFVSTSRGRTMPIDAETARCAFEGCGHPWPRHDEGICNDDACGFHTFQLEEDWNDETQVSHFSTCTNPKRFSRKRGSS